MKKDRNFLTIADRTDKSVKNTSYILTPWQSESIVSKINDE
jgi:hypothetical protein